MNLDLRIDELVLHGVASADREQLAAAIAQALTQLFEQRGVPACLVRRGDIDRLGGHAFSMRPGDSAEATGARIAQAIYDSFIDGGAVGALPDRASHIRSDTIHA